MKKGSRQYASRIFQRRHLYSKIVFTLMLLTLLNAHISSLPLLAQSSPDFTVNASPSYFEVPAGRTVTYPVFSTSIDNFAGQVSLNLTRIPAGVIKSYSFSIKVVTLTANVTVESDLTIITSLKAQPGYYIFTVNGSSSTITRSSPITLSLLPSVSSIPSALLIPLVIPILATTIMFSKNCRASKPNRTTREREL